MIAFGPVPSRRLGQSLGINNIPPKVCSYSCVYCQVGRTSQMQVRRGPFYEPEEILRQVQDKIKGAGRAGEAIDYLALVPDGEPTLDINLGRCMALLKPLGIKIAVITNASLLGRKRVRKELMRADWVSLKIDSTHDEVWRKINRPHGNLQLASILDGALQFARSYRGELVTETMLVENVNDSAEQVEKVGDFLACLQPARAYLSVPIRPPAEKWVRAPGEKVINRAHQILSQKVDRVEYLIGYEGNAFAFTGDVEQDLLSITAVHPMRAEAVGAFLARAEADWSVVRELIRAERLREIEYEGTKFYMRRLNPQSPLSRN